MEVLEVVALVVVTWVNNNNNNKWPHHRDKMDNSNKKDNIKNKLKKTHAKVSTKTLFHALNLHQVKSACAKNT